MYKTLLISACVSLFLTACLPTGSQQPLELPEEKPHYGDGAWHLIDGNLDGKQISGNEKITLELSGGRASGFSGVNTYSTAARKFAGKLSVDEQIQITRMAGTVKEMRLESQYLQALRRVKSYKEEGNQLFLTGEGVELNFRK
ncbi:MAG: META domain-containing protein [Cardiobacteriaceae bacterium]|nr:META domain-containing protein [Cardiobacteriaceae bacterium]